MSNIIQDKVSEAIARQYDYFGANDAIALVNKEDLEVNRQRKKYPDFFAAVPALFISLPGAWLAINFKLLFTLPDRASSWVWNVENNSSAEEEQKKQQQQQAQQIPANTEGFPNKLSHYLFGVLGFGAYAGVVLAFVAATFLSILRLPKQFFISLAMAWSDTIKFVKPKDPQPNPIKTPDKRHWFLKILGFPGYIGGAVIASPFAAVIVGWRFLRETIVIPKHSWDSLLYSVEVIWKTANSDNNIVDNHNRDWVQTYLLGFPGIVVGAIIGTIVAIPVVIGRVIINSARTFTYLAKTYLNAAIDREVFDNVGTSKFIARNKYYPLGIPGMLLSLLVMGFAAAIFIVRNGLPIFAALWFPLASIRRGVDEIYKAVTGKWRLADQGRLVDAEYQVFRTLYANKNALDGKLPEHTRLLQPPIKGTTENGGDWTYNFFNRKSWAKFIRKALTWNAQTLHEEALSTIYQHLQRRDNDPSDPKLMESLQKRVTAKKANIDTLNNLAQRQNESAFLKKVRGVRIDRARNNLALAEEDLAIAQAEAQARALPSGVERNRLLIKVALDKLKQTYKYKSRLMMSPREKEDKNLELDTLGKFVLQVLSSANAQKPSQSDMPSSSSSSSSNDKFDDPSSSSTSSSSVKLPQANPEPSAPSAYAFIETPSIMYVKRHLFLGTHELPPPPYSENNEDLPPPYPNDAGAPGDQVPQQQSMLSLKK